MKIMKTIIARHASFLIGAGSTVELMPRTKYEKYIPTEHVQTRVERHFEKAGRYLDRAAQHYAEAKPNR